MELSRAPQLTPFRWEKSWTIMMRFERVPRVQDPFVTRSIKVGEILDDDDEVRESTKSLGSLRYQKYQRGKGRKKVFPVKRKLKLVLHFLLFGVVKKIGKVSQTSARQSMLLMLTIHKNSPHLQIMQELSILPQMTHILIILAH